MPCAARAGSRTADAARQRGQRLLTSAVEAESTRRCARPESAFEMGTAGWAGRVGRRTNEIETDGWLETETINRKQQNDGDEQRRQDIPLPGGHRGILYDAAAFGLFRVAFQMAVVRRRPDPIRGGPSVAGHRHRASNEIYKQTRQHRQGDAAPAEAEQPATAEKRARMRNRAAHYLLVTRMSMFRQAE